MVFLPPRDRAREGADDYLSQVRFYHVNGGETSSEKTIIAEIGVFMFGSRGEGW